MCRATTSFWAIGTKSPIVFSNSATVSIFRVSFGSFLSLNHQLIPRYWLKLPPLDYFRQFNVDTALFGAPHAVRCVLEFFGPQHVLFGTDMPLGPSNAVEATIADIDAAGLSSEDRAAVYSGNAVRLLGLPTG